jgi:hypothetical protein
MTTHKLKKNINITKITQKQKNNSNKINIDKKTSKKTNKKKYNVKGGANYHIRGITEKETAVDIVRTLCDYDPDADNTTYYRFEFYVSSVYQSTTRPMGYVEIKNKAFSSAYLSATPLSGEGKDMILSCIYENEKFSVNPDPYAETDFDDFCEQVFNILNVMDRAGFSIYGDAILLCKDITIINGASAGNSIL